MMLKRALFLVIVLGWVCLYSAPELKQARIHPWDSSTLAVTGAFYLDLFSEFPHFLHGPGQWCREYYSKCPALAVRRHPPVFPIVEAGVYALTGVSGLGANLSTLLFSLVFALGIYFMCVQFWKDDLVALTTVLLVLTTPIVLHLLRSVWLDIPSLAFAAWAFYLYGRRLDGRCHTWPSLLLLVLFMTLSLNTYQLPVFLLFGLALHWLVRERKTVLRDKKLLVGGLLFVLLMMPLTLLTFFVAKDNLGAVAGQITFPQFVPVHDRASLEYWVYYLRELWQYFPVQIAGIALWAVLALWRRPSTAEWLFAGCFLIGYVGFSWITSKSTRCATYFALAASPLTVLACRDLFRLVVWKRPLVRDIVFAGCMSTALVVQACLIKIPNFYLAHMDQPVQRILAAGPKPRIFYSGNFDACFIYYLHKADEAQQARVWRATVQTEDPEALASFLKNQQIDVIVFEGKPFPTEAWLHGQFRKKLARYLAANTEFACLGEFQFLVGEPGREKTLPLLVYTRQSAHFQMAATP
jgi:hypothetical protein